MHPFPLPLCVMLCRYERHFTPNVALAPVSVQKKDGEQEENREEEDCMEMVDSIDKRSISNSASRVISPLKVVEPSSTKSSPPQHFGDLEVHNTDTDDSSYGHPSPGEFCLTKTGDCMLPGHQETYICNK